MKRTLLLVAALLLCGANLSLAQDPYARPSIEAREALTGEDGVIPQPFLAMTNANVIDVRTGDILANTTITVRDGYIQSVGDEPPDGAHVVDLLGRYVSPGLFEGQFHGGSSCVRRRCLMADT